MDARSNLIGRTLAGRFKVGAVIGEGAMAAVYRGTQEAEPREVALKIMHAHLTTDRTFVARFKREAKAAAQIVHPNSVRIIDFGIDGYVLFIAMELLAGRDLFDVLAVEGPLPWRRAVRIMVQVADALAAAHTRGIVHRDLKPENIMLVSDPSGPDGERVKVLDFGIAKLVEREAPPSSDGPASSMSAASLTTVGMLVGTPAYMSPEQCLGEPIDARSDVYASGVVLYQMLTRRLPFEGDSIFDLAKRHEGDPPDPPTKWVPTIDRALERLVLRAMAKDPADRQASAVELRQDLERVLAGAEAQRAGGTSPTAEPRTESRPALTKPVVHTKAVETLRAPGGDEAPDVVVPRPSPPRAVPAVPRPPKIELVGDPAEDAPVSSEPDSIVTRPSFVIPGELVAAAAAAASGDPPPAAPASPPELVDVADRGVAHAVVAAGAPHAALRWDSRLRAPVLLAFVVGVGVGASLCALLR